MVDDDAQFGQPPGQFGHLGQVRRPHQRVELQVPCDEVLHVGEKRPGLQVGKIPAAAANAAEERIFRKAVNVAFEGRSVGIDVPHQPDYPRVGRGQIQNPLIVRQPRTRFHHHRPGHPFGRGQSAVVRGQYRAVEQLVVGRWPRHAFRSRGIVEVGMGVDDHDRLLSAMVVSIRAAKVSTSSSWVSKEVIQRTSPRVAFQG